MAYQHANSTSIWTFQQAYIAQASHVLQAVRVDCHTTGMVRRYHGERDSVVRLKRRSTDRLRVMIGFNHKEDLRSKQGSIHV